MDRDTFGYQLAFLAIPTRKTDEVLGVVLFNMLRRGCVARAKNGRRTIRNEALSLCWLTILRATVWNNSTTTERHMLQVVREGRRSLPPADIPFPLVGRSQRRSVRVTFLSPPSARNLLDVDVSSCHGQTSDRPFLPLVGCPPRNAMLASRRGPVGLLYVILLHSEHRLWLHLRQK